MSTIIPAAHVPTADERVLPGGTAYITDLGMTGPYDGALIATLDTADDSVVRTLMKYTPAGSFDISTLLLLPGAN